MNRKTKKPPTASQALAAAAALPPEHKWDARHECRALHQRIDQLSEAIVPLVEICKRVENVALFVEQVRQAGGADLVERIGRTVFAQYQTLQVPARVEALERIVTAMREAEAQD